MKLKNKVRIKTVCDTLDHLRTKVPKKITPLLPGYGSDVIAGTGKIITWDTKTEKHIAIKPDKS